MHPAITVTKTIVGIVVAAAAGHTTQNVIKSLTPETITTAQKVIAGIGTITLAGAAGVAASNYATDTFDDVVQFATKFEVKTEFVEPDPEVGDNL